MDQSPEQDSKACWGLEPPLQDQSGSQDRGWEAGWLSRSPGPPLELLHLVEPEGPTGLSP